MNETNEIKNIMFTKIILGFCFIFCFLLMFGCSTQLTVENQIKNEVKYEKVFAIHSQAISFLKKENEAFVLEHLYDSSNKKIQFILSDKKIITWNSYPSKPYLKFDIKVYVPTLKSIEG